MPSRPRPLSLRLLSALALASVAPAVIAAAGVNAGWTCLARTGDEGSRTCGSWFSRVLAVWPETRGAHAGLAVVDARIGDAAGALGHLEAGPRGPVALIRRGEALHALGREAEAISAWRAAGAAPLFFWQARDRDIAGRTRDAIELYERVLAIDPGARLPFWSKGEDYQILRFLIRAQLADGRAADAARVAQIWTEHPSPPGEAFFLRGLSELKLGEATRAETSLRAAIARDPGNWAYEAGWWLGQALERQRNWDAALAAYAAVDRVSPTARTAASRGSVLMQAGDRAAAIGAFRRALEIDPAYRPGYLPLAVLYRETGDRAAAARVLAEGLSRWPGDAGLELERRALTRADRGDPSTHP